MRQVEEKEADVCSNEENIQRFDVKDRLDRDCGSSIMVDRYSN